MGNDLKPKHISVCICTFRRTELLSETLTGVTRQITDPSFTFEVVVVDNDRQRSAEKLVRGFQRGNATGIIYDCEPEQNIALARNRAIQSATGNLLALIDDDECPVEEWLVLLYRTMKQCHADGVLGPVLPAYPSEAPRWIKKASIFNRKRFPTGTILSARHTRTGNALLARTIFACGAVWFDPAFGLSGGEDTDFFEKQIALGRVFVWCDEAVAHETIPLERWQLSYHKRKFLIIGATHGAKLRKNCFPGFIGFLKAIIAVPVRLFAILVLFPFGRHRWVPPFLKLTYSVSSIFSYCGLSLKKTRY